MGEHTKVDFKKLMPGPDYSQAKIFLKICFLGEVMNTNFLDSKYDLDVFCVNSTIGTVEQYYNFVIFLAFCNSLNSEKMLWERIFNSRI